MYEFKVCKPSPHFFQPDHIAELPSAIEQTNKLLREHLTRIGYPEDLWPLTTIEESVLTTVLRFGQLPTFLSLNMPFEDTDYIDESIFKRFHPSVRERYLAQFLYQKKAFYCFTRGEEWWDGEKMFLVSDAGSFFSYCRYSIYAHSPELADYAPKQRGRPRNVEKQVAREESSGKYQQWVQDCRAYRKHLTDEAAALRNLEQQLKVEAQLILDNARESIASLLAPLSVRQKALQELKAQGAPKRPA